MSDKAEALVKALGGADNIVEVEPCASRLRVEVVDPTHVDQHALKAAGAHGVLASGTVIQVIIGPEAEIIALDVDSLLDR